MIPRGVPFPQGPPIPLCCPVCLLAGTHETLRTIAVFSLGPGERQDALSTPFYRYRCGVCRYIEVHMHLLRGRPR